MIRCKVLLGSLLPDYIFKRVSPLMVLAVAILGNGIGLALLPTFPGTSHEHINNSFDPHDTIDSRVLELFKDIISFNICMMLTGFTFGIVDMGVQSLILKSWVRLLGERQIYFNFRA